MEVENYQGAGDVAFNMTDESIIEMILGNLERNALNKNGRHVLDYIESKRDNGEWIRVKSY
jgi:hypothetical protein